MNNTRTHLFLETALLCLLGGFLLAPSPAKAQTLSPLAASVVAGDTVTLTVTNLPTDTNAFPYATTVRFYSYDETRLQFRTNAVTQRLVDDGAGNMIWEPFVRMPAICIQKVNGLFEPIPVDVVATWESGGIGAYWTATTFITPEHPTFSFTPAVPAVRVGNTTPVVIRRTTLQANANLYFTLSSDDESILGIGTNSTSLQTNKTLQLMFSVFEPSKTIYVSGLATAQSGLSTNIRLRAQVGSYITNTPVLVSPNEGLVLSPASPQVIAGGSLPMTVSRSASGNISDLMVYLSSDNPHVATVPESVLIPAGAQSASFIVSGILPGSTIIRSTALGVSNSVDSARSLTVTPPSLSFSPSPASNVVNETRLVTLSRPFNEAGADLTVNLSILTPGFFTLGTNQITLLAGHVNAYLPINGIAHGEGLLSARVGTYTTNLVVVVGLGQNDNDPDNDGILTEDELRYGWDPYNAYSQDPMTILNDGDYDSDGDGLSNYDEIYTYGTSPIRKDTDDDGIFDGEEVSQDLTNPLHPMSSRAFHERSMNLAAVPLAGITLPNPSRFAFTTNGWTVECWLRPGTDGNGQILNAGVNGTNTGFWMGLVNFRPRVEILAGTNLLAWAGGTNSNPQVGDIQQLPANEWSHMAFVWSPERNSLEVYVNGILLIARESLAAPSFTPAFTLVGKDFSDGYLDDLRVWAYDRNWDEVEYWHNRYFPAPSAYVPTPEYGQLLRLYYRFDDGGSNTVDFAYLNNTNYFIPNTSAMVVTNPAVSLLGYDDEDGDFLPEWWTKIHSLDVFPDQFTEGPDFKYFDNQILYLARVGYSRAFRAYASIGTPLSYKTLGPDVTDGLHHKPVDTGLGFDGRYASFMRYVYLYRAPLNAQLRLFTPGMTTTVAYVNGQRVTPEGGETNQYQTLDVTTRLKPGRNLVYVRCESQLLFFLDEERTKIVFNPNRVEFFEGAYGKFDASLECDNVLQIVRGDYFRNDPRSVWFCQTWSTHNHLGRDEAGLGDPIIPDKEGRGVPGSQDYGLPFDADTDLLNALYEFLCGTNPRAKDSNNNGIPDNLEDFDGDGLPNGIEQARGSHPLLPDTDDDGVRDGLDAVGDNDPASALSPLYSRSMRFEGGPSDYILLPRQKRFALQDWTVEALVRRDPSEADGGIVVERIVGPSGVNYELGLGDGLGGNAGANIPYVKFISVNGVSVIATNDAPLGTDWTHLAGSYDSTKGFLTLYVQGVPVQVQSALSVPAIYAGGPVIQNSGRNFVGNIDELRVWKKARSAAEIQAHFNKTISASEGSLAAYYRFDDGTSYTNSPLIGTSANNWSNAMPWTWGQVQEYSKAYDGDWWEKWTHGATLSGTASFTTNGDGALDNPPSLQVNLQPTAAVEAGAQWRVSGFGDWYNSAFTLSDGLEAGVQTITFQPISGWSTPSDVTVALSNNFKTVVTVEYAQNGSLRVDLSPPDAVAAGAQWRVDGGAWQNSGVTLGNMAANSHLVEFRSITGWSTPAPASLEVQSGLLTSYIASYNNVAGSIQVYLSPEIARTNGARWSVDGGAWRSSGEIAAGLPYGPHTIAFSSAFPWIAPSNIALTLNNSETLVLDIAYELLNGGMNDTDGDGLTDLDEIMTFGSDPLRPDTDEDGVLDGQEVVDMTDPLHPMSSLNYAERSLDMAITGPAGFSIPDPGRFYTGTNGWTVEYWIRPGADGDGEVFALEPGAAARSGFRVGLENFRPKAQIYTGTNQTVLVTAGGTNSNPLIGDIQQLPPHEWSHVAHIWSPAKGSFEIYINGLLLIAQKTPAAPNFDGGNAYFARGFADGYLDDVRTWDYDRSREEASFWFNRIFPAPAGYVRQPETGNALSLYYRFDDGGTNINDFAHLNQPAYFLQGSPAMTATNQAITLLGCDDEDGDQLPEWWVKINKLDKYPTRNYGPNFVMGLIWDCFSDPQDPPVYTNYFDSSLDWAAHVEFFASFRAYGSIGAPGYAWLDPIDNMYYAPKDTSLGYDGRYSAFMKYIMLSQVPKSSKLEIFTPGMVSTKAYVNGVLVTPEKDFTNTYQNLEVAQQLKTGRNMVYIRCESGFNKFLDAERTQMANPDYKCNHFERAYGKFDASLDCDGVAYIKRGDHTRNDPRAVWIGQAWSTHEEMGWDPPDSDLEFRALPGNKDYGLPFDADTDGLNAFYEFLCGTNPRDDDSNNNGIPDGLEDYDGDGLNNGDEQLRGAHPLLPDSDDDGVLDGLDSVGDNDPASALVPIYSRAMSFSGAATDFVGFPKQDRFALTNWSVEAWINPANSDGGVIIQRQVSPVGINYELGLLAGNVPYLRFVSVDGNAVAVNYWGPVPIQTWTHLAGTYDASRRQLMLYVNGTNSVSATAALKPPAIIAGGPVIQRIGSGFQGMIDEVRIWKTPRTGSQILSNFPGVVSVSDSDLAAYYRFDDGTSYNPPMVGTSWNNWTSGLAWSWGQVQDYVKAYQTDWWNKWFSAASMVDNVAFTTNNGGALFTPPILQVTLYPPSAVQAGAQWRLSNEAVWHDSDYSITDGLNAGAHRVVFKSIDGWITPQEVVITLSNNTKTVLIAQYQQNGALRILLAPPVAVAAGAQWRMEGGEWLNDGAVAENLLPGNYLVECKEVSGWTTPGSAQLLVSSGQTNTYLFTYTQRPTGIQAFLTPDSAILEGAQWRINEGAWLTSGTTYLLTNGTYTVDYAHINGWLRPLSVLASVTNGNTTTLTGRYYRVQIWEGPGSPIGGVFNNPRGMAFDSQRRLYIADTLNNRIVTYHTISNTWQIIGSAGSGAGQFNQPMDVYVDLYDNLYVADAANNRIQMRRASNLTWTNWSGFSSPLSVAVSLDGIVYVADTLQNRVLKRATNGTWAIFLRSITTNINCSVEFPRDLEVDAAGNVYVADAPGGKARLRKVSPEGLCFDVLGSTHTNEGGLSLVNAFTLDTLEQQLIVADRDANRIMTRSPDVNNWAQLIGTECLLDRPEGVVEDGLGHLYIADTFNNRVIRLTLEEGLIAPPAMASFIRVNPPVPPPPGATSVFSLNWIGQDNVFYSVEYTDRLMPDGPWYPLSTMMQGSNALMNCVDTNSNVTNRFYRITAY